jgi:hypothetical protein
MSKAGLDNRRRNKDGEISYKHGNTLIGTLRINLAIDGVSVGRQGLDSDDGKPVQEQGCHQKWLSRSRLWVRNSSWAVLQFGGDGDRG